MDLNWTSPQQGKLRKALLKRYKDTFSLRLFISDNFPHGLSDVNEDNREKFAFDLISKASSEEWINDLYQIFCNENAETEIVLQLKKDLGDVLIKTDNIDQNLEIPSSKPNSQTVRHQSEYDLKPYCGKDKAVHLVVAVYWEGSKSSGKVLIDPKICYRNAEESTIDKFVLDDVEKKSCFITEVPEIVEQLTVDVSDAVEDQLMVNNLDRWTLTIEIFVPIELLCKPIFQICGKHKSSSSLLSLYPVVVGCSDRFSPTVRKCSVYRNKMREGWWRLQDDLPDLLSSQLSGLRWLTSDEAEAKGFLDFSGFKCYGSWLGIGDDYLQKWDEFITSGIPIAFWMCESETQRTIIDTVFEELTSYSIADFLEKIPRVREDQRKNKSVKNCVGIFYEDPNYLPQSPNFLAWPDV